MSLEKNCKWYFGPQARGNEKGPNNPTALTFKGTKYHSLIRESIQNSLDAVLDPSKPVTISFTHGKFYGNEYPEFFELKDHIEGCLNKYPDNPNARLLFNPMLDYFRGLSSATQEMGYLRVTDINTTGMSYDPNDAKSPFNAFISEGIATKPNNDGAGGAFGFGKAVFWMASPISTVFVSTKTADEHVFFEGQTKLCTHYLTPGQDLAPNGLYDTNGQGEVICNAADIPDEFLQKEVGTSVFVLGHSYIDDYIEKELTEAVLRNFWLAIYNGKLVVQIEDKVIDQSTLPSFMESYCAEETNNKKETYEYNPRSYYNIVVRALSGEDNYKVIEGDVEIDGIGRKCKLYLHKNPEAKGFFGFLRSQYMTIYVDRVSGCKNAEGVFVCDDKEGNKFLRELEDYSHDSWDAKNFVARGNNPKSRATQTLNAIYQFIKDAVKDVLDQDAQDTATPTGLEDVLMLSTPETKGDNAMQDAIVDPDTLLPETRTKKKESTKKEKSKAKSIVTKKAKLDPNGRLFSNSGGHRRERPVIPGPIKPGNMKGHATESEEGKDGVYAEPVTLSYRTWSQIEDDQVVHIIRLFSNEAIDNAIIEVFAVDEDGRTTGLDIMDADGYTIRVGASFKDTDNYDDKDDTSTPQDNQMYNAISGVSVNANIPKTIKLRFNSDIKYSLRINTASIKTNEN